MFNDLWNQFFILLFGILFIEDAVGFVAESGASETIGTLAHIDAIKATF